MVVESVHRPIEDQAEAQIWTIVTQYKSDRILYLTQDPDYQPPINGDASYVSGYQGALPEGMSLANCWAWSFRGGVFFRESLKAERPGPETLVDSNRKALHRLLREKIDAIRKPYRPECVLGDLVRREKLAEALGFETEAVRLEERPSFPFLQCVAIAQGTSLQAAAALVRAKHQEMTAMLRETERFRCMLGAAIEEAKTQEQLMEIRSMLLDDIYPNLSERFGYLIEEVEPDSPDAPLRPWQAPLERTRLREQLTIAVNQRRASTHSGYIRNDEMRRYKLRLAQIVLANIAAGRPPLQAPAGADIDFRLIVNLADVRALDIQETAKILVASALAEEELLATTEQAKEVFLQRIDRVETHAQISALDRDIAAFASG